MFYLCTVIQGLPKKTKLTQLQKKNIEELKPYVRSDDDIQWIENDKGEVVFGKSKLGVTMFEKEADKYVKVFTDRSHIWSNDKLMQLQLREAYKDGAEFGYNKANEWHYVKDGKYPKENQLVMVYRVNPLGANIAITNWYDSYKDTKVIAWEEIVLPELPKEIE